MEYPSIGNPESGYRYEFRPDGVYLTVYPAEDELLFELSDMRQILKEYGVLDYDVALLARLVREASGEAQKIAEPIEISEDDLKKFNEPEPAFEEEEYARIVVEVTRDKMKATVKFDTKHGSKLPTAEMVLSELKDKGIVYGIDEDAIAEGVTRFSMFVAAEGDPPIAGENAYIDRKFNLGVKGRPVMDEYDRVDYKNLNLFVLVKANDTLAIRIPWTKGTPGKNIYGDTVPAQNGRPIPMPNGKNTIVLGENQLIAAINGQIVDILMNLMGELVINKVRIEQIGQTHRIAELTETLEQMDRVTTDLQNIVMKVRMVPVSQVFNRFPRMVRDVTKELNKEINLTIEGEETELDRTVIDEIGDPIMHLLRNSLDHGVEMPDDRVAKGKPRVGEVKLIARHEGNNVVIMVTDDGKGIDADVIRRKAVEKGLYTQDEVDKMDDADAVRIIFLPGFSTAEKISDISGRGVGMDVVRSKIEALSGHVDVETHINEGSIFKIKLPLTLAIIQAMMVRVQDEMYAIPLGSIDSTISIQPDDIKTVQNREVIVLRGEIIPIIRMEETLAVPHTKDWDEIFVVVVHSGEAKAGLVVDRLIGQQEIVIKTLGNLFMGLKMFSGATVLGDGRIALILDVATMMQ